MLPILVTSDKSLENTCKKISEAIGIEAIGEFMVKNSFPILIKRIHFKMIRDHITKQMNARTFEQAFNLICRKI